MVEVNILERLIVALINLIGILLALWVYSANSKEKLNQWFVVMTFSVIFWVNFSFLGFSAGDNFWAVFFYRLNASSVSIFLVAFYYFYVVHFLKQTGKYEIVGKIVAGLGVLFAGLSVFTDLIIQKTIEKEWGHEIVFGPANDFFNFYAMGVSLVVITLLIKRYFQLPKNQKSKIEYFLVGTFLFVLFNILFNVIFPLLNDTVVYQHFGDYSAIFLLTFTAYAVVRQNLFGIKIIISALLVSFIAALLSLDIFIFTELPILQAFKVFGLITFLFLGRNLIKNVLDEEKQLEKTKKLNNELARANDSLKELIEMKTSFLHIVSHQLRTPLTAMRGYLSMWQEGSFDDFTPRKMAEMKKRIVNNAERLNNLVNEMVVVMESEGGIKLDFTKVDVEEIIKNNIEFLRANYEKKKLYIKYQKKEKNLPKIDADAKYLSNVFMNLIDNAEKYTKKGGLKIKICRNEDDIKVAFSDTGVGIKPEDEKRLFHKFSRGESSSLINPNGSGLGLYIIKQIVREHNGSVKFESEGEGKGTTFTVTLPIHQPASAA